MNNLMKYDGLKSSDEVKYWILLQSSYSFSSLVHVNNDEKQV